MPNRFHIGVDTGGTFTDLVAIDGGGRVIGTHKLLSTPDDPGRAVLDGIAALTAKLQLTDGESPDFPGAPPVVIHGSTVATNALLEGTGMEHTAFITTAGFEDTLHIARQHRPQLYALVPRRPDPPLKRSQCFGVTERMRYDGSVITPLDDASVRQTIEQMRALQVQSIAISLLHSYANPAHEQQLAKAIREALGDRIHLTISHELLPVHREYERASACVINAVVAPRMTRYIGGLRDAIGEDRLRIMGSHGGTLSPGESIHEPVRTILSGPAGGALGAALLGGRLITLDMGGTSTDVALIDGQPTMTIEGDAAGLPVHLPMIDIHTIGAGGGSIAWLDPGGALRVGPRSAGADPGPACYGKQRADQPGGWKPTVTDAHVVLGHIPADATLGDDLKINRAASIAAVSWIADKAGLTLERAAEGVLSVVEANMMRAVHRISLQRGHDPRDFALVPFGGAGGLHACRLAEALGMGRVIVPVNPGLLSAVGMLTAPPKQIATRSLHWTIPPAEPLPDLTAVFSELADSITAAKQWGEAVYDRQVDMRYAGQSFEITLDHCEPPESSADLAAMFHKAHEKLYGYRAEDRAIELVVARCIANGPCRSLKPDEQEWGGDPAALGGKYLERESLRPGDRKDGPCIIKEYSATTVLREGWTMTVRDDLSLLLEHKG